MAEGLPSRNTIGTSLQTMSRNTPPKIPVITPIIEAMKRGMWASSAEATPAMENRPRPMASAITIRRSETIWRMARIRGEAPRASTKIRMAYSWWVTQNRGRWSSRMSRRVPPPKAVMNATVNTPTRSMRFLRASIKPENAPTRIARISMRVISDMRCELLVGIATGYHAEGAVGDACRRGDCHLLTVPVFYWAGVVETGDRRRAPVPIVRVQQGDCHLLTVPVFYWAGVVETGDRRRAPVPSLR